MHTILPSIHINEKYMNRISKLINTFSTPLSVTPRQIQKKLALAPVYILLLFLGAFMLCFAPILIQDEGLISELFGLFLAFAIGILLVYFLIAYVFIYALQLALLKRRCLNLYSIFSSAMILTLFFTSVISIMPLLELGIKDFQWAVSLVLTAYIGVPALLFALMYWFLLFRQHRKNESANLQEI